MCDVCKAEGEDYRFKNGPKKALMTYQLYKVFRDSIASVRLCYVHSIELFMMGEQRFLKEHLDFARNLANRSRSKSSGLDSPFGL